MAGIKWYQTPNDLGKRVVKYGAGQQDALLRYAKDKAPEIRDHMKTNRRWTDRTHEARLKLDSQAEADGDKVVIHLVTGAPHGVFLEQVIFRYAGHLEIIRPTMDTYAVRIMDDLRRRYAAR